MATMKAVMYKADAPGGVVDADLPKPTDLKAGQVLVRVRAAAVNPVDYKLPKVPVVKRSTYGRPVGLDLAGVVEAVGPGVELRPGDEVYGNSTAGTIADFCVAEAAKVAPKPGKLSFEEAAALPTVGLTSLQALDRVGAGEGKRVLIIGGSGGCGALGVQMAKAMGAAHVTATCSAKNVEKVREHGADEVIDYNSQEIPREPPFDCIYDTVTSPDDANYSGLQRTHLAKGGKYAQINGSVGDWLKYGMAKNPIGRMFCSSTMLLTNHSTADLTRIARFVDDGAVRPQVQEVLPFSAAGVMRAFELLQGRRATGKLVFAIGA
eukprot:CAMPEP_0176214008 /NCGR_PEP_ID=MMETSP0121_2-20121125/15950_1 /TAXON_ID=160619 /ORGANISM="Kryptoperidinium foliaceum, Strain CCMP 1326" /LENGTH=320 /DNA_ID=CAMNT_0017553083 /DNA_START=112 /DNA_END=1074 /DNA_ORIENTATION=+